MCGIVGIFNFNYSTVNKKELEYFTQSLHHRGPDDSGIYINKEHDLGLGHTRTSIFDLSEAGKQPMTYTNERYWLTFNGEIYNFIEIREELKSLGCVFKSDTDSEVILAAYFKWGEKCQYKFNGDWAFAIWDNLEKNLFLSVDRVGAIPLYYYYNENFFIFASELKSFMYLSKRIKPDIDYGYLLWLGKTGSTQNTLLKNVYLVNGGYQINIKKNKKLKLKKWWKTIDHLVDIPKSYEEQVDHFKYLFTESCKIRMRSDVPTASCLSGGIDSSAVVSTIKIIRQSKAEQSVFIAYFKDDPISEKHFAEEVILNKNINVNYCEMDTKNFTSDDLVKILFDQEAIDADGIFLSLLYKDMRSKGFRVSIDGCGPDEYLGGFHNSAEIGLKDAIWPWSEKGRFEDLDSIRKEINGDKISSKKLNIFLITMLGINKYIGDTGIYNHIEKTELKHLHQNESKKLDFLNSHLYDDFHFHTAPYLAHKYNKTSMSHGVETRAPFIDHNLFTYAFSLPSSAKVGQAFTKRILRDAMREVVPTNILNRKDKRGFTAPTHYYDKIINYYMLDTLNNKNFKESNIFDGKKIKKDFENKKLHSKNVIRYTNILSLAETFKSVKSYN